MISALVLGVTFNYYNASDVFEGQVGYGAMSVLFTSNNRKVEIGFLIAGNAVSPRIALRTADSATAIQNVTWTELNI